MYYIKKCCSRTKSRARSDQWPRYSIAHVRRSVNVTYLQWTFLLRFNYINNKPKCIYARDYYLRTYETRSFITSGEISLKRSGWWDARCAWTNGPIVRVRYVLLCFFYVNARSVYSSMSVSSRNVENILKWLMEKWKLFNFFFF